MDQKIPCLVVLIALFSSGCATFGDLGVHSGEVKVGTKDGYMKVVFSNRDKELIRDYYVHKHKHRGLPPGLAKRQTLPPGLQKRIEAGQELPPGLQGRYLPDDLERVLSPLPGGYIRLEVAGDIAIMNKETKVVFDVIKDIAL